MWSGSLAGYVASLWSHQTVASPSVKQSQYHLAFSKKKKIYLKKSSISLWLQLQTFKDLPEYNAVFPLKHLTLSCNQAYTYTKTFFKHIR